MVHLLLGIHDHQPVGNFGSVLEKAYAQAYRPFFETLERHPHIKIGLHCSGILYEWLETAHPEFLERLGALARAGRVELIGGAFYEPILTALPEKDQRGQIERMRRYLRGRFGAEDGGFWLAERVWEPQLPKVLARSGVRYTIVDDTHFLAVGFSAGDLTGYFLTEAEGKELRVFPISQRLRYMMPYASPEEVIDTLRAVGEAHPGRDVALVMADDGEKFGLWPKTHERVYGQGWLDRFFTRVGENASWLRTSTFSEYLRTAPPLGLAYLPTTSYAELSEWALGPEAGRELVQTLHDAPPASRRFVRGGYFRNFLTKYPESNRLYRKMLRVSGKVHGLDAPRLRARVPEKEREAALMHLWKGQCNCAYWHGVFGGLYLPHLRGAVYRNLLSAERAVDRALDRDGAASFVVAEEDWDADGSPELLIESPRANWYFSPGKGAGLWEWDLKLCGVNLAGVVSRRPEAYHERLKHAVLDAGGGARTIHDGARAKEAGLERELAYDWHGRMSLLDHFLHPDTRREDFAAARYGEQGDFVLAAYRTEPPRREGDGFRLAFERDGTVWCGGASVPVRLRKRLFLSGDGAWRCEYSIENRGGAAADLWFGTELALAFSTPAACPPGEEAGVSAKIMRDPHLGLEARLSADRPLDIWSFPLYTISQSEDGFEKTYQGSVLLLHRRLRIAPGEREDFSVSAEARPA